MTTYSKFLQYHLIILYNISGEENVTFSHHEMVSIVLFDIPKAKYENSILFF